MCVEGTDLIAFALQEPSQDMEALKSFFQNTWNAQRSQVPVASGKMHKQQPATASGMEAQRAAPAAHTGRNPVQTQGQKPANGASGFLPQQSMSLPNGWQNMQVIAAFNLSERCCWRVSLHMHNSPLQAPFLLLYPIETWSISSTQGLASCRLRHDQLSSSFLTEQARVGVLLIPV